MTNVNVTFYGVLAELAQKPSISLHGVSNTDELKQQLLQQYPDMAKHNFIVAVNNQLINKNTSITNGDQIAVMPPFSGG